MGLDMYLTAEKIFSANEYEERESEVGLRIAHDAGLVLDECSPYISVSGTIGYWRKANAIHGWFVKHVANGVDDCSSVTVSKDDLLQLREACLAVLNDTAKAASELPPTAGFFFGYVGINQGYFNSLQATITIVDRALKLVEDGFYITYQASW